MQLDAFVLNQHIFTDQYYVAPLSIPDHSAFLPGAFSAPDVVPHVDIDSAYPWYQNSRIADVTQTAAGTGAEDDRLRKDRLGVYLHWCLPRRFRGAAPIQTPGSLSASSGENTNETGPGISSVADGEPQTTQVSAVLNEHMAVFRENNRSASTVQVACRSSGSMDHSSLCERGDSRSNIIDYAGPGGGSLHCGE